MKSVGRTLSLFPFLVIVAFLPLAPPLIAQSTSSAQSSAASVAVHGTPKSPVAPNPVNLPLFFEANQGQSDPRVRFLTRSSGYSLLLTPTETVLAETTTRAGAHPNQFGGVREILPAAGAVLRMQLVDANLDPAMSGLEELPGKVNYLIGNDRSQWHTGVSLFSRVRTAQVYPGVDLVFHGDQNQLEYDFVVAPGADPSKIKFRIRGASRIEIDSRGDLVLHTPGSGFRMHKPVIYQTIASERRPVEGSFVKTGKREIAFRLAAYDHTQALVIDPSISYSTFLGGNGVEQSFGIAVDDTTPSSPKLYLAGFTSDSTTFGGQTPLPFKVIGSGTSTTPPVVNVVGFVAKIDPTAKPAASLVYLTFIGGKTPSITSGTNCVSEFIWLTLDKSQGPSAVQPVIGGQTTCSDFPSTVVLNPVTATTGVGSSALATRLTVTGAAIDKSALLGGNDSVEGGFIAVDTAGNILISGNTEANNLPAKNAYISTFNNGSAGFDDCFVSRLNRADMSLSYLTYLNVGAGSTSSDNAGCGAFLDSSGNILAGGNTFSATAFNLGPGGASLANGFQPTFQGTEDTFAMDLNPSLTGLNQLLYATYYGGGDVTKAGNGSLDLGNGVVAIVGSTTSGFGANASIPTKNAFQTTNLSKAGSNGQTGFLLLLDSTKTGANSLLCSTYFGGSSGNDFVHAIADDASDPTSFRIVIGGETQSPDFPTLNSLQPFVGTADAFLSVLRVPQPSQTPFSASLYLSTFIGSGVTTGGAGILAGENIAGVAVDVNHIIYAEGHALSSNFFQNTTPATVVNGFQTTCTSCSVAAPFGDLIIFSLGTASDATLQSITVSPASATIGLNGSQQFTALGFFSDGTAQDLTATTVWKSSNTGVATINTAPQPSPGFASAVAASPTPVTITATSGTVSGTASLTVQAADFQVVLEGSAFGTVVDNLTPHQINCTNITDQGASGTCSTFYPAGTQVTLTETPGAGSQFGGWGGNVNPTQCPVTSTTCTITVAGIDQVTLTFNNGPGTFTLTVQPAAGETGGGIVGDGRLISCTLTGATTSGVCSDTVPSGSILRATGEAQQNSTFAGWSGAGCSGTAPCFITMSADQNLFANFPIIQFTFTAGVTGTGSVSSTSTPTVPTELNCANPPAQANVCLATFNAGTQVTLTANPGTGQVFNGWTSGPCNTFTTNPCIFTLTPGFTLLNAAATFVPNTFLLTAQLAGTGTGSVSSNVVNGQGGSITNCHNGSPTGCSVLATFGGSVMLTATPTTGVFAGWSATPTACNAAGNSCTFNMPAAAETVTATFNTSGPGPALSIVKAHTGNFTQGQHSAQYTVTVSNGANAAATSGTVTVTDTTLTTVAQDIVTSFSGTANPNGVWSYGQYVESPAAFSLLTAQNAGFPTCGLPYWSDAGYPDVIANNSGLTQSCGTVTIPTDELWLHPTNTGGTDADVRWTAPADGTYEITGSFSALDSTSTTDSILVNGTPVFSTFICNPGNGKTCTTVNTRAPFSVAETLTKGSTVDFTVNCCTLPGQNFLFDSTGLTGAIDSNLTGLSLAAIFGQGWTCGAPNPANTCTRSDALAPGASYPPITVLVNVGVNAPSPQANTVNLTGGGSAPASSTDSTTITPIGAPVLSITKSHTGNFTQGQQGATYTVAVSNAAGSGPTNGSVVTVTDTIPTGLTLSALSGTGWVCTVGSATCTTSNVITGGLSYPPITVTVNVLANAPASVTNAVTVVGGGSVLARASDPTTIAATTTSPVLAITKSHAGNFTQGQQAANYTVTVSNGANAGPTSGTVTVTDAIPAGLTLAGISGTGWTCGAPNPANTCTRADVLNGGASYPSITVTVNVAANAPAQVTNSATASGGGNAAPVTATDPTTIAPLGTPVLSITKTHAGDFTIGQKGALYTVTVSNAASAGPTNGSVNVTDAIPAGLSLVSMTGTGWSCEGNGCSRSDALAAGASYPSITVTVNVTATAATQVTNSVTVTGGGSTAATANDPTNIAAVPFTLVITPPAGGTPGAPVPVSPGGQIAVGLILTPIPGFSGTVTFTCTSSAPQFITCNPDPKQVTLSPGGTQVAVVVNTFCSGELPAVPLNGPGVPASLAKLLLTALAMGSFALAYRRRSRWLVSFAVLVLIALGGAACNSLPKGPSGATPPGAYTLFITATANGQSATVQQPIQVLP